MRASKLYYNTYKEEPAGAELKSHKLMLRAGMIKQHASGIYSYLPIGLRVIDKINKLVKKHMDNAGANQVHMPTAVPQEIYKSRISKFGPEMFKFKDRKGVDFCLTPTHEELFALTVKDAISSYKHLPIILYQIGTKYRDEIRPRHGINRSREFIMKDAYSFDIDSSGMMDSYISMYNAYVNIFKELEIDFKPVLANAGQMGGSLSEEFMAITDAGEDIIIMCDKCQYAANEEKAEALNHEVKDEEEINNIEKFNTPNIFRVEDLVSEMSIDKDKIIKTLIYIVDEEPIALMLRGSDEIQEKKLEGIFKTENYRIATEKEVYDIIGCKAGYIGPYKIDIKVIADNNTSKIKNFIIGANIENYHLKNINFSDIKIEKYADFRKVNQGDLCNKCKNILKSVKGIEIGHIFQLGKSYSKEVGLTVLDAKGKNMDVVMGSYGIGIGRTMAAIIDQKSDNRGIIWPNLVAPFNAVVIAVNNKDSCQSEAAEKAYKLIKDRGADVLIDDRKLSFGQRIKDAELIGIPYIIVSGKKSSESIYEFIDRKTGEKTEIALDELIIK